MERQYHSYVKAKMELSDLSQIEAAKSLTELSEISLEATNVGVDGNCVNNSQTVMVELQHPRRSSMPRIFVPKRTDYLEKQPQVVSDGPERESVERNTLGRRIRCRLQNIRSSSSNADSMEGPSAATITSDRVECIESRKSIKSIISGYWNSLFKKSSSKIGNLLGTSYTTSDIEIRTIPIEPEDIRAEELEEHEKTTDYVDDNFQESTAVTVANEIAVN